MSITANISRWKSGALKNVCLAGLFMLLVYGNQTFATNRVSTSSGDFSKPGTWSPTGIPVPGDQLTIQNGHTVTIDTICSAGQLTVANGGRLDFMPGKKLTLHNNFLVYGIADIVDGDMDLITQGASFHIGATGSVTWSPANNTSSGATLFLNGDEYFHPGSTLIIKKWYNYSNVPLGSVVTGNFGNLTLNTLTNGLLYEWNQDNEFETHKIEGTLTIEQGWVVFDRSGSISNTTVGAIHLSTVNAYLDIHSGTHPGSFNLTTASITNIGGKFNGIYNGEGNIHVKVNGDFTNLGNVVLIYNSGIQGIANGNASMEVTGKYFQSMGDFRGVFNLSSTTSGKADLEFGEVKLTGGIFMGNYACHTAGNNASLTINGNLEIDFLSGNSKFRGNGLTTLSGTDNNLSLQLIIDGDLIVKGIAAAEFTSSGSTGAETTMIKGQAFFEGCTSNFNFGFHSTTISILDNVEVKGGTVYFSRTGGTLTALLQKNLILKTGNLTVTGGTGNCNLIINGDYQQSGGSLFFHNNNTSPTYNVIYTIVHGNFFNHSGNITFDNNSSSTVQHRLSLNGEYFTIGGSATINTTVSAVDPKFGIIYYDHFGEMQYLQNSSGSILKNVKQVINSDCSLKVMNGNMQIAESITPIEDMLLVTMNGILDLGDHQLYGINTNLYTSLLIDEDARLRISGEQGLYNGTVNASINATGNMVFILHPKSVVEYYGSNEQIITGTGLGNAASYHQQYGIIEINKTRKAAKLKSNLVMARQGIALTDGELDLNGFNLMVNNGAPSAITRVNGYIRSEGNSSGTNSMVKWKNISQGLHIIPFGMSSNDMLPFSFTPISGFGNEFAVSTRSTGTDNRPLTNGVLHLNYGGGESGNKKVIDRWFHVSATGIKANITASYLGEENTTHSDIVNKNFSVIAWNGINWKLLGGTGTGVTSGSGAVSASAVSSWGPLLLISNERLEAADILSFNAMLMDDHVALDWTSMANIAPEKYTIERSEDEFQFDDLLIKTALPPAMIPVNYKAVDNDPLKGISWYRLKQHQPDGKLRYSRAVRIDNSKIYATGIAIESVSPNPFSQGFLAMYTVPKATVVEIKLTTSNGQVMHSEFIQGKEGKNTFEFTDNGKVTPGIYILTISNGTSTKNIKLFHI
ncbi:MAG: T9SS type A sorting domain-containing protein [Bacteroidota bacterium]|nr:T9SS type A sorting domain-containing protein [Bacteroidota bacterium]